MPTAAMTPLMSLLVLKTASLHGGQGDDRFSLTGTVTNSTLVGGSGADLADLQQCCW